MKKENFKLQFITNATMQYDTVMSAHIALDGGCKWIQLRMKDATQDEIRKAAIDISTLCRKYNATFIIDDHIGLVEEVGANGVHLGLNDMPIKEARKMLGKDYIIGGTANTFQDVRQHFINGADYIGCGPFRFTTTKKNLSPILGLEGYRQIIGQMKEENINIPLVAIGGIKFDDISHIMKTGVNGIAISGGILNAENPVGETARIIKEINININ